MDPQVLKEQFIGWQCRIRQYAVRKDEGRPCPGMRPSLELQGQNPGWVNVQIVKTDSEDVTREFQFMIQNMVFSPIKVKFKIGVGEGAVLFSF